MSCMEMALKRSTSQKPTLCRPARGMMVFFFFLNVIYRILTQVSKRFRSLNFCVIWHHLSSASATTNHSDTSRKKTRLTLTTIFSNNH